MVKKNIGTLFILAAACLWGTAGIFVRTLSGKGLSSLQTVFVRSFFTIIIMALIIVFTDRSAFKINLKDIWIFALNGIASIVMFNYFYYKTMSLSTLSVAAVLLYTAPFFVIAISVPLFKEKLTVKKIVSCICAFIGCCFVSGVFGSAQKISGKCLVYGLLTGFGYALYTIFGNILVKRGYSSLTVTFYTFLFAFIGCIPISEPLPAAKLLAGSTSVLAYSVAMALINTVLPYIFYTNGLRTVESAKAPVIATVEPVAATIVGITVFSEKLTLSGAIGIILVLGSVILLNVDKKNKDKSETEGKEEYENAAQM